MEKRHSLIHNEARHRYEFQLDRGVAYVEYEPAANGRYRLTHTIVPPQFEGQGIGRELVESTLEALRAQGVRLIPDCTFIITYIQSPPAGEPRPGSWGAGNKASWRGAIMEYLFGTAVTGQAACARRRYSALASEIPQCVIFPSRISSAMTSATVSGSTLGSGRCW